MFWFRLIQNVFDDVTCAISGEYNVTSTITLFKNDKELFKRYEQTLKCCCFNRVTLDEIGNVETINVILNIEKVYIFLEINMFLSLNF